MKKLATASRAGLALGLLTMLMLTAGALPAAANPPGTGLVISQVYGGGGNANATYTHDFVELFNPTSASVSLEGWSLQYASATGTGNLGASTTQLTPLSGSIEPGKYVLVREASNAAVGTSLPEPYVADDTPIAMAAGAGKVALVNTTTPLGCNGGSTTCTPASPATIVHLV